MNLLNILTAVSVFFVLGPEPLYNLEKLNSRINTQYDEINPVVSLDGQTIYFTRVGHPSFDKTLKVDDDDFSKSLSFQDYSLKLQEIYKALGERNSTNPVASSFNQDIWIAGTDREPFDKVEHPSYPLNSALPNSVCAVTTDPSTIVIVNQFFKDGSMQKGFSFAKRGVKNSWKFPEPLFIYDYYNIDEGVNLTLSKDNEVMILSLARKDGEGQNDLYVSFRVHTTLWSAPEHMGSMINTSANELTPFISDDKQFIFFSSNRPEAEGGQDIFVSERLDDSWTNWSTPQALPAPINSLADDAQPFLNRQTGYLYFTSTREGSSDIFRVKFYPPSKNSVEVKKPLVNIPKPVTEERLSCVIVDAVTGDPIEGTIKYGPVDQDGYAYTTTVGKSGLLLNPGAGSVIKVAASQAGYITRVQKIDLTNRSNTKGGVVKVAADPIKVNTRISLDPIFFMRGNERILSGSYAELDRLGDILKEHPNIQVNINGHTDNVGDQWALYQLSETRAAAVKRYLVKIGVPAYRIKTKGYGPSKPITDNSSEHLRAKNRRVEVLITKV